MSAAAFKPGGELPAASVLAAPARILVEELLARALEPCRADAEVERLPAAAYAKDRTGPTLASAVLARLSNASLFGARRIVVVLGGLELLRDASIQAWSARPSPRTHLVLAVVRSLRDGPPSIPERAPFALAFEPGPRDAAAIARFLQARLAVRGSKAGRGVFDALLERVGPDLDLLDSELEKLSIYRGGEPIELAHVEELCGRTAGRDFDRLWQALQSSRRGEALAVLESMTREGLAMFGGGRVYGASAVAAALLPMLLARIRRVAAVAGSDPGIVAAAAAALGMKPGYVHFLQRDARALGRRLERWQAAAVAAEVRQKRIGLEDNAEIVEDLIVELSHRP